MRSTVEASARLLHKTLQARVEGARYHLAKRRRAALYRGSAATAGAGGRTLTALEENGYAIVPGAFSTGALQALSEELDAAVAAGRLLPVQRNPSVPGPSRSLGEDELARGAGYLARQTNYVAVRDPLVACPASVPLAFSETLIDLAAGYLGCQPAVSGLNLRLSFVNDLPEMETNLFHCDENSPRFLKFFLYLNDVDADGGPFCYVSGSHRRKPFDWRRKYHWDQAEMERHYGAGAIRALTARAGDLLLADTAGFHRGRKVRTRARRMLTVNYGLHRDFWKKGPVARLPARCLASFTDKQRAAADFLELV